MRDSDRVILIKGDSSKWYEQAIFVVRKNISSGSLPMDYVLEAEKIISNYLTGKSPAGKTTVSIATSAPKTAAPATATKTVKKKNGSDTAVHLIMLLCCFALAAFLLINIL